MPERKHRRVSLNSDTTTAVEAEAVRRRCRLAGGRCWGAVHCWLQLCCRRKRRRGRRRMSMSDGSCESRAALRGNSGRIGKS